ncbi:hypothetical protein MLD38_001021 [Melastoma candidum]|uniref:Uncharacterized protein n=1 Tax=Melastoma candidum TaxID=119954 RepID=A0ACB9SF93_9MYRT|nr:hypothetical protein MLD38_001021 [Melastoma candidum]
MLDKRDTEELVEEEEGFGGEGGRVEKRRRLSVDQVKSLERSFEKQNKLETERKSQLAEELGLQPKQVAIWFQNRRARWKSKQLERDYGVLKSGYDSLKADYDCLDHENKSLLSQLAELKTKLQQRSRAAEDNPDNECRVVAMEECPISEPEVTKPKVGYSFEIDTLSRSSNTLVKDQEEKEGSSPNTNLLEVEMGAVMPISTTEPAAHTHPHQGEEEHQHHHIWLNYFLVDQAPTLQCCSVAED